MRPAMLFLSSVVVATLSAGCESLYDDYVQVAAELLMLRVGNDLEADPLLDAPFDHDRVEVICYLYEARNMDELGSVPAEGATVLLESDNMSRRPLEDRGNGTYGLDNDADDKLRYIAHGEVQLTIYYAGKERKAWFFLPDSPALTVPQEHAAGQPMDLDLDPQDFDGVLSMVFGTDGAPTLDERPTTLDELLGITEMGETGAASLPGSAFSSPGPHAVGVAGVRVTRGSESFENMDNEDCRMAAASMDLAAVDVL